MIDSPSDDMTTPDFTKLRSRIALFEQKMWAGERKLKAQDSYLLGRLSAADERVRKAPAVAKASLKRQFTLKQELASL